MKRLSWTIALGLGGFGLAWQSQGIRFELGRVLLVTVWFALIGYGFGRIFDTGHKLPKKFFVLWWSGTLALIGPIFSGFVPLPWPPAQICVAGAVGALVGATAATLQLRLSSTQQIPDTPGKN
jgi:hypothetical protein